jgi:hypothetical protein
VERCPVGEGELVRSQGQTPPLLEPADASLDRVALLVRLGVEGGPPATRTASAPTVTGLVERLGNDSADRA